MKITRNICSAIAFVVLMSACHDMIELNTDQYNPKYVVGGDKEEEGGILNMQTLI